jgi:hypothetical protein
MMKSILTRILVLVSIFKLDSLKGCFQILISLRSPKPLCFNHWFNSLCHGLSHWSNVMPWQSNFIPSIWHKSPYLITVSGMEDMLGFMHCPLHLTSRILNELHTRRSWWPVSEFDIDLQQEPFFNHMTVVNGGVILLKLDYSTGIKNSYRGHNYVSAKCACTGSHPGDTLYDGAFKSLHGRYSRNSEETYDHCI